MSCFCSQCGKEIDSRLDNCPYCGAINFMADGRVPRTIDELRQFAAGQGLPLEKMRMFLGENYTEPKAYGIYRADDGLFVVYKNKADGTRAERYHGPDEARAVNELYQKMLEEMTRQRDAGNARPAAAANDPWKPSGKKTGSGRKKASRTKIIIIGIIVVLAVTFLLPVVGGVVVEILDDGIDALFGDTERADMPVCGYYQVDGITYFYTGGIWYSYDESAGDWAFSGSEIPYTDGSHEDYYLGGVDGEYDFIGFYDSDYYQAILADGGQEYYAGSFVSEEPAAEDDDRYYDDDYDDDYYGGYYYYDYYDDDYYYSSDYYDYDDDDSYYSYDDDDDYSYDSYDYSSWDSGGSDWDSDW